jgi:hypothetical protein
LIALIINVHTLGRMLATAPLARRALDERISRNRTLMRKTRLLRKIEPTAMRSSVAEKTIYNPHVLRQASAEMIWRS